MNRSTCFYFVMAAALILAAIGQPPAQAPLRIFINEVQPGAMSAPQYCTLIFSDHRFHTERGNIKQGNSAERKIYEGQMSDADWNALGSIIDNAAFRDLKIPLTVPPPVMQDTHPYTISVARDKAFQNMEFLDQKSLKPYEAQVKPLLQWWKLFRGKASATSAASPDSRCKLDSTHAVFAQ